MAKKPARARTDRRTAERAAVKLAEARLKLAALEAGGSPDRPIEVTSASVVEPHAASLPCVACGQNTRVEEHVAITTPRPLRVARVRCARCGTRRDIYFRLGSPLAS
jgi:hypothetical protein